jgi:hypothetical protein
VLTLPATSDTDIRGNVIGAFANVANIIAVQGNIGNTRFLGGNVAVSGQVNVLGNVVAPFFVGNGSRLTGLVADVLPSVIYADIENGNINGANTVNTNTVYSDYILSTTGRIGGARFDNVGGVTVDGELELPLGNVICNRYIFGNAYFMTGGIPAELPPVANTDIVGNVIGAFANVANIIAVRGNVANVIFDAGNVTTPGFVYQGTRSATYTGSGTQSTANTTPNVAVQFPTTALSTGTLGLTRQNASTRFINLTTSTRLFQVSASIPFEEYSNGFNGRRCEAYIQYTSSGGSKVKVAAVADSRPNMGNDLGQILNLGALVTLETNAYFELFANATYSNGPVSTVLTNTMLTNPVITIVQLN